MSAQVSRALETYLRLTQEFGYPHGDAFVSAVNVTPGVSSTALRSAINHYNAQKGN
jgi:hypothetical protein